jgi:ATP-dependent DNA ligase
MNTSLPEWIVPMAATLTQDRFTGPEWIFERKYDGIRLLAFRNGSDVRLYSRNRLPQRLPSHCRRIAVCHRTDPGWGTWAIFPVYHVFDMPWFEGRDVSRLPLDQRARCWRAYFDAAQRDHRSKPWERVQRWMEGVIAKRRDSLASTDARHWLKMKC